METQTDRQTTPNRRQFSIISQALILPGSLRFSRSSFYISSRLTASHHIELTDGFNQVFLRRFGLLPFPRPSFPYD